MSPRRHSGPLRSALRWRRTYSGANLRQRAWEDGVLGGDRRWLVVGGASWVVWAIRWAWRKDPEVIYRTEVKPGDAITIATAIPLTKKEAKQLAREEAQARKVARSRKAKKQRKAAEKAAALAAKTAKEERKAERKVAKSRKAKKQRKAELKAARKQGDVERALPPGEAIAVGAEATR